MAIAFIGNTNKASTNNNSVTTDAVDTTGANLIVLFVADGNGTTVTPTDSKSNTWTSLTQSIPINGSNEVARGRFWFCPNPAVGASHTFTVSGTGIYPSISANWFSGAHASATLDQQNTGKVEPGTSVQTGSITPSEANCLVITGTGQNTSNTPTVSAPFSTPTGVAGTGNAYGAFTAYEIQTTATARNPTWSWTSSGYCSGCIASFKAAAAAGGKPWTYYAMMRAA